VKFLYRASCEDKGSRFNTKNKHDMKKQIIILCAIAALAGCNRSPEGGTGTGTERNRMEGVSTNSGGTTNNTNRFGTSQGGTGTGTEQTQPPSKEGTQ
jgi:hypothetical protein